MLGTTLSTSVRSNLLSLQDTAKDLAKTQARLATGLLVAQMMDGPTAFSTARSLSNRAGDLNRLLDSVGLAERSLEAADAGIEAISSLVESAQSVARQALAAPAATPAAATGSQPLAGAATLDTLSFANGDTVEIATSSGTTTFTVTDAGTQTVDDLVAALDANPGAGVTLSGGKIRIAATDGGDLTVAEGAQGTNLDELGLTAGVATASPDPTRQALAASYNELLTQIDQLAADSGFNGANLLNGQNLPLALNESGASSLTIEGVRFDAAGLGISAAASGFQDDASVNAALTELDNGLTTLRSQASTFGSNLSIVDTRQSLAKSLINTLEGAAADLTIADTNAEGARLLALDTRQQLSTAALSIATSEDRNVLGLF